MKDVFVSYSTKDKAFVSELVSYLKNENLSVWIDEGEILPGDRIRDKIHQGIFDARYLVVVLSENSIESDWVQVELDAALLKEFRDKEVFVIPVLTGKIVPESMPFDLQGKLYVDFRNRSDFNASANRLAESVEKRKNQLYQYDVLDSIYNFHFNDKNGADVTYHRVMKIKANHDSVKEIEEVFYTDGEIIFTSLKNAKVLKSVKSLNTLHVTFEIDKTLSKGEEFSFEVEAQYKDSFLSPSDEYWITNHICPTSRLEYIFWCNKNRPFLNYSCTIRRGVKEIPCNANIKDTRKNGLGNIQVIVEKPVTHDETKFSWTW